MIEARRGGTKDASEANKTWKSSDARNKRTKGEVLATLLCPRKMEQVADRGLRQTETTATGKHQPANASEGKFRILGLHH
jgi:hypothetical protein